MSNLAPREKPIEAPLALFTNAALAPRAVPRVVDVKVVSNERVDPALELLREFSLAVYELEYTLKEKNRASAHMKAVGLKAQLDLIVRELGRRK